MLFSIGLCDEALVECAGSGYRRAVGEFSLTEDGQFVNDTLLSFGEATGRWPTVTHAIVFEEPSGRSLGVRELRPTYVDKLICPQIQPGNLWWRP